MTTLILEITVPDEHAETMRKHLERMATQDVRVGPVEFARRNGFTVSGKLRLRKGFTLRKEKQ